jgi:hypothetical protein
MSGSRDEAPGSAPAPESGHRSRWRRFSPSMGWRAFWSEIVIVVLGVVIALAANEAVQEWNWRNKVKDAEARLEGDVTWAFLWSAEKIASQPCVDAQLAALARTVNASGATLQPTHPASSKQDLQYLVRMGHRPYRFTMWDALVADGTATHFSRARQEFFGRVSDSMDGSRHYERETRALQGSLLVMRDAIPLDAKVRMDLLTLINRMRAILSFEALNAAQRMRTIADGGSAPPEDVVALFLNASGKHTPGAAYSGIALACAEMGHPMRDWRDYKRVSVSTAFNPLESIRK